MTKRELLDYLNKHGWSLTKTGYECRYVGLYKLENNHDYYWLFKSLAEVKNFVKYNDIDDLTEFQPDVLLF